MESADLTHPARPNLRLRCAAFQVIRSFPLDKDGALFALSVGYGSGAPLAAETPSSNAGAFPANLPHCAQSRSQPAAHLPRVYRKL